MDDLCRAPWLRQRQRRWPHYVYHHTSVLNAVSIIRTGTLFSRTQALSRGLLEVDAAHPEIIKSSPWAHDLVRMYFRPRTPTHWWVEGIRPPARRHESGAHIGVPVFLLFDSRRVLSMDQSSFSAGTMASSRQHSTGNTAAYLTGIDFRDVLHDGPLPSNEEDKKRIQFAKQAEVLVPKELGLDLLRGIVCRSAAERNTLLYLLEVEGVDTGAWASRVIVETSRDNIFQHEWAYVTDVRFLGREVQILHHPPKRHYRDPSDRYHIWLELRNPGTGETDVSEMEAPVFTSVSAEVPWDTASVEVHYRLCNALAYRGVVEDIRLV